MTKPAATKPAATKPAATKPAATTPTARRGAATPSADVGTFVRGLDHPLRREIERVRAVILGVDPAITEAIKWNAPSFRTTDFFATVHLRSRATLQLVFHTGAKAKATATTGVDVPDPAGLLRWLAPDRCLVTLGAGATFDANCDALAHLVAAWITWV
ncbi:MAG: DUF1801 domain-containing protein [Kofleriaceae bacterium]